MGEYLRPDVYIERIATNMESIESVGTATAGFVGTSVRGKVGESVLVTSWSDYVSKFSRGLKTPFTKDSDLAYAIYGYFQNGGSRAFVVRVADETSVKATATVGTSLEVQALDEGTWANGKLKVSAEANEDQFDLIVKYNDEVMEVFERVVADSESEDYILEVVNGVSNFIEVLSVTDIEVAEGTMTGGVYDTSLLEDADYLGDKGIKALSDQDTVTLVAIPGQTSKAVAQGILDYCSERGDCFGVPDIPMGMTTETALAYIKELKGVYGAMYYPWGKVVDPIGKGRLKLVPPSGHVLGIYARTDRERGVHKAPAGLEADVRGFVETERTLANGDIELLNQANVNCITAKPNNGIVVWGARMITPHLDRKYVSDIRLDINIEESLYKDTQWTVFEPNDEALWNRITAQVKAFLYVKWTEGALFGTTPSQAYYVKCDEELNTEEIRNAGRVLVDVGYAKKKPNEFTIFRLSQKTSLR